MLLVPATMELLGDRNWWMPAWLDRILPQISVEGPTGHDEPGADNEAEADPDPDPVVVVTDRRLPVS